MTAAARDPAAGADRRARAPGATDEVVRTAAGCGSAGRLLCAAWNESAPTGVRLVIGGADREAGRAWLARCGVPEPADVERAGDVPHATWLARVARARLFVNASRREDYGQSQLEALAAGTPLVTVPSPGAYEALPIARRLAPDLVAADLTPAALATALRAGSGCPTARAMRAGRRPSWRPTGATPCSPSCATKWHPRSASEPFARRGFRPPGEHPQGNDGPLNPHQAAGFALRRTAARE